MLHKLAIELGTAFVASTGNKLGLTISSRFTRLAQFAGRELGNVLSGQPATLGRTRLALWEGVPPMSLHVGVVRFGLGPIPVLDVLYDTTDSLPNMRAFCHIAYHPEISTLASHVVAITGRDLGVAIAAHA